MRTWDTRSVNPGPEGKVAEIADCISVLAMILSRISSRATRTGEGSEEILGGSLKSNVGFWFCNGMPASMSEAFKSSRCPFLASSFSRRAISDSRCCTTLRGILDPF